MKNRLICSLLLFSLLAASQVYAFAEIRWESPAKFKKNGNLYTMVAIGQTNESVEVSVSDKVKVVANGQASKTSFVAPTEVVKNSSYPIKSTSAHAFALKFLLKYNHAYVLKVIIQNKMGKSKEYVLQLNAKNGAANYKAKFLRDGVISKKSGPMPSKNVALDDPKLKTTYVAGVHGGLNFHSYGMPVTDIDSEVYYSSFGFPTYGATLEIMPKSFYSHRYELLLAPGSLDGIEDVEISGSNPYSLMKIGGDFIWHPEFLQDFRLAFDRLDLVLSVGVDYWSLPFITPYLRKTLLSESLASIFISTGVGFYYYIGKEYILDGMLRYLMRVSGGVGVASSKTLAGDGDLGLRYIINPTWSLGLYGTMVFLQESVDFNSQLAADPVNGSLLFYSTTLSLKLLMTF
ncbi:MAG: hypothetical protein A2451_10170 [Bdellovibrionales bacterium RIFOXYC2_FULL_39_8]|nr:MAG: hypothetical protein A2451_10170 [Bdellovibrionales bacterium RIFOXYC2_FULL_39_8]